MEKEEKIDKIMNLVTKSTLSSEEKLDTFRDVLDDLSDTALSKLVAGVVFAEKPFKAKKKIWRIA